MVRRLLNRHDLRERGIGYSAIHLARLELSGRFPRHVMIGDNRVGWIESEVEAWINGLIETRDHRSRQAISNPGSGPANPARRTPDACDLSDRGVHAKPTLEHPP
jgi:prophage regulatory protein